MTDSRKLLLLSYGAVKVSRDTHTSMHTHVHCLPDIQKHMSTHTNAYTHIHTVPE